jgi:hypothetical protein
MRADAADAHPQRGLRGRAGGGHQGGARWRGAEKPEPRAPDAGTKVVDSLQRMGEKHPTKRKGRDATLNRTSDATACSSATTRRKGEYRLLNVKK